MTIIIYFFILLSSFLIGIFGFCQIIGTIKYFKTFNISSVLSTIIIWTLILGFGAFSIINWLPKYSSALYISYILSFLMSFSTKPDKDTNTYENCQNSSQEKNEIPMDLSIFSDKDKEFFLTLQNSINSLQETYNNAVRDLGDMTVEDVETAYKYNKISKAQYDEFKNSIESLIYLKESCPRMIKNLKDKQLELINEYKAKT